MGGVSVRLVLLCEDSQTDSFVRRFLSHRNFRARDIRTLPLPHGGGSGEQWVRNQYPRELRAIRGKRDAYFIVVMDADAHEVDVRKRQLDLECDEQGVSRRAQDDRVIVIVPKWSMETWFAYLQGDEEVGEDRHYPRLRRVGDCRPLADRLFRLCHEQQRLPEPAPPSLVEACEEYRKLRR